MPQSIIVRWVRRPPTVSSAIAGMQSGGYLLFAGLINVSLLTAAHRRVITSPIWIVAGTFLILLSAIIYRVSSLRAANRPSAEPVPSAIELRERVLARMGYDVVTAYPTRSAALRVFPALGVLSLGTTALTVWTDLVVWPFAIGSGAAALIAVLVFLAADRQYRRDLHWALDFEEPPIEQPLGQNGPG